MNLHDGPTGLAIREERNHKINASNHYKVLARKRRAYRFPKLHRHPNPMAHRNAIWKARHNMP